ncbi:MAG: long-chain fatty acid--CoA ligase, partial [Chloroflexi bacterium]
MATFNLSSMLRESALANPDKPALILDDLRMSYRELDEAVSLVAAGLRARGIGRGDRVGVMLPNVPQFPI